MAAPTPMTAAVAVRQRVVAFEAPLRERRTLHVTRRTVSSHLDPDSVPKSSWSCNGSVAIADASVFRFVSFLLSREGSAARPHDAQQLLALLVTRCAGIPRARLQRPPPRRVAADDCAQWEQWEDATSRYTVASLSPAHAPHADGKRHVLVLVTYRPHALLPLCMASARRAVRLVHAVVALVTANAYISTLGGGHFLCRQLDRSTLMAKLQIAVSLGLQDPILESKCRVNLAYNALQLGRFKRARRILRHEQREAERLASSELRSVCHAAVVYLDKMQQLHEQQLLLHRGGSGASTDSVDAAIRGAEGHHTPHLVDNFYRQRIVRLAK